MNTNEDRGRDTAKMAKLRHAVDRLRALRVTRKPVTSRQSWLERLKQRLGLSSERDERP